MVVNFQLNKWTKLFTLEHLGLHIVTDQILPHSGFVVFCFKPNHYKSLYQSALHSVYKPQYHRSLSSANLDDFHICDKGTSSSDIVEIFLTFHICFYYRSTTMDHTKHPNEATEHSTTCLHLRHSMSTRLSHQKFVYI